MMGRWSTTMITHATKKPIRIPSSTVSRAVPNTCKTATVHASPQVSARSASRTCFRYSPASYLLGVI